MCGVEPRVHYEREKNSTGPDTPDLKGPSFGRARKPRPKLQKLLKFVAKKSEDRVPCAVILWRSFGLPRSRSRSTHDSFAPSIRSPLADLANLQFAARAMPDFRRCLVKIRLMMYQSAASLGQANRINRVRLAMCLLLKEVLFAFQIKINHILGYVSYSGIVRIRRHGLPEFED